MCEFDPEDVIGEACGTKGGLKVRAYYAFASDIDTPFPKPNPNAANLAEAATVTADFIMKTGKKFWVLDADLDAPDLVAESQGNLNNLSADNKYTFRKSGTSKQLVGWLNANRNRSIVLVVEDRDGNRRVLGEDGVYAKVVSFQENTGKVVGDDKFIEFVVYAPGDIPYFYEGAVPLTPAA